MRSRGIVIAIDGPAGAGKTTAARNLARRLGYRYLDTGSMFRAVAWKALHLGIDLDDRPALEAVARDSEIRFAGPASERVTIDGQDVTDRIRTPEVSRSASQIAGYPGVRESLTRIWREAGREGGVILEGRDIGSVVFPDAEVKFYLDARVPVRAERRLREQGGGEPASLESVAEELARRDVADRAREVAPLTRAEDAILVDTTELSSEETAALLESHCRRVLGPPPAHPTARPPSPGGPPRRSGHTS